MDQLAHLRARDFIEIQPFVGVTGWVVLEDAGRAQGEEGSVTGH